MADEISIQSLKISVTADTTSAVGSIGQLTDALKKLAESTKRGFGDTIESLQGLANAVNKIVSTDADKFAANMEKIAKALEVVSAAKIDTGKVNAAVKASNVRARAAELEAKKAKESAELKVKADKIEASRERAKILAQQAATAAAKEARIGGKVTGETFDDNFADKVYAANAAMLASQAVTDVWRSRIEKAGAVVNKCFMAVVKAAGRAGLAIAKMAINVGVAPFKKLGASIADVVKRLSGFLSALKRIAVYRAIRAILKEITQAFREGVENLYQYSLLINGTFAASMDSLATSALYAKNSLAAMAAPMINVLAPAVDFIVDKFVDLLNVVNELVACLTGAETWTKAIKYPTQYAEAADGANGAAKKLRATLLGFDEINRLDDNNKGRRGSAGESLDYSSMFEEQTVSSKAKSFITAIKNAFASSDLKNLGKNIGEKIKSGLDKIDWNSIKARVEANATMVGSLINGFIDVPGLADSLGRTISQVFNTAIGKLRTFFSTVKWDKVGTFLGDGLNSIVNTFSFSDFASTIATIINSAIAVLKNFIDTVDWFKIGEFLSDGINDFFDELHVSELAETISDAVIGAINMIWTFLHDTDFYTLGQKIGTFIKDIKWGEALEGLAAVIASAIGSAVQAAGGLITSNPLFAVGLASIVGYKIAVALGAATVTAQISSALGGALATGAAGAEAGIVATKTGGAAGVAAGIALTGLAFVAVGWLADKITDGESTRAIESAFGITLHQGAINAKMNFDYENEKLTTNRLTKSLTGNTVPYSSPYYADGGYPEAGSLFIAGERGAELVSYSSGRTQVANRDQIAASVASGMEFASEAQNALLREQNNLLRELVAKDTNVVAQITTGQLTSALNRANQRSGSTIVPVY